MIRRIIIISLIMTAAAWQSSRLGRIRRRRMPEVYQGYSADVPPALNFVMAGLGGFRGIVSEILWFRVNRLQEEGRYVELVQLSEWITMLEPHAAEAWVYNAWNMAYNISVMMVRPEDRLRWVKNGISLLRDDGLRYNPKSAKLFRELAWLYQNKIGMNLDSAHMTYKFDLLASMQPILDEKGTFIDTPENRSKLNQMKLDLSLMKNLEKRFGALDWRLANVHALYWADRGLRYAAGNQKILCRRAVYQPLMLLTFNGKFTGDPEKKTWKTSPCPSLALPAAEYLKKTLQQFPSKNMRIVYYHFMPRVIKLLDKSGEYIKAEKLYADFKAALPADITHPSYEDVLNMKTD
ncbi:MAG: hypothetical protein R6V06_01890 [Kiritimatiellia bacterium]